MNEQLQRMLTRNPLVPLAVVLFGSVWFAISIVVFCLGLLFPSIRAQPPPTVSTSTPRQRRRNGAVHLSTSSANNHPYPSMLVPKQSHPDSHVNFPGIQSITPPTRIKRWSSPGFLPPASAYQDIDSTESFADSSLASVSNFARVDETASFDASPSSTVSTLPEDMPSRRTSLSSYHKRVLSTRLPGMNVFRTRSKKSEKDGVHSRSSSIASTSSLSSAAPSPNSSPTRKSMELPESGETYRTSFVSPFKFRPKRSSASAALMSTSFAEKVSLLEEMTQTPSPPPSPDRPRTSVPQSIPESSATTPTASSIPKSRRKAFSQYLNLNLSIQATLSPISPRMRMDSISSAASGSNSAQASGSQSARVRSFAFSPSSPFGKTPKTPKTSGPVPRTQPYGAPYYAMMPNGEYAAVPLSTPKSALPTSSFSLRQQKRPSTPNTATTERRQVKSPRIVSDPSSILGNVRRAETLPSCINLDESGSESETLTAVDGGEAENGGGGGRSTPNMLGLSFGGAILKSPIRHRRNVSEGDIS